MVIKDSLRRCLPGGRGCDVAEASQTVYSCIVCAWATIRFCRRQGLPDCRGAGIPSVVLAVWGPPPLAAKLVAGHGAGMSENPGKDARMPPGARMGSRMAGMSAGCMATPGDPGPERTPARDHPAGPGSVTSWWSGPVQSRSPGRRRVWLPSASVPSPTVTLSDMGGGGEHSPSRSARHAVVLALTLITHRSVRSARIAGAGSWEQGGISWEPGRRVAAHSVAFCQAGGRSEWLGYRVPGKEAG